MRFKIGQNEAYKSPVCQLNSRSGLYNICWHDDMSYDHTKELCLCNPEYQRISVWLFFLQGKWSSTLQSFICERKGKKAPKEWKKMENGRIKGKKGLLNKWSMRLHYLTSKTLKVTQSQFWPSLCSFSGWRKACDMT